MSVAALSPCWGWWRPYLTSLGLVCAPHSGLGGPEDLQGQGFWDHSRGRIPLLGETHFLEHLLCAHLNVLAHEELAI